MDPKENMQRVQGLMVFLGSISNGLELLLGRGSTAVCFRSGRTVGLECDVARKETDLFKALDAVREEMLKMGINWPFEPYKKESEPDLLVRTEGGGEIKLVFKNCIARCTLFRYGFPQEMSLCQTKHGLFCGLFQKIYGAKKATLDVVHSGENACLLKLSYQE